MARETFQTLSEPMYYILLALLEERCGVDIMKRVEELSHGRIRVGPGTSYTLLDKFLKSGLIQETKVEGRKKSYLITEHGKELLQKEYVRLHQMIEDGNILEHMPAGGGKQKTECEVVKDAWKMDTESFSGGIL